MRDEEQALLYDGWRIPWRHGDFVVEKDKSILQSYYDGTLTLSIATSLMSRRYGRMSQAVFKKNAEWLGYKKQHEQ